MLVVQPCDCHLGRGDRHVIDAQHTRRSQVAPAGRLSIMVMSLILPLPQSVFALGCHQVQGLVMRLRMNILSQVSPA